MSPKDGLKLPLTKQWLDNLEELFSKATPGVWKTWGLSIMADQAGDSDVTKAVSVAHGAGPSTHDIDLICAMQRALPSLIAAGREAEEQRPMEKEEGAQRKCTKKPLSIIDEMSRRVSESLLREVFRPRIQLYAVHVNCAGASFVKDFDYYASQGGLEQSWGKHWTIVAGMSDEAVRVYAMKHLGARLDALYCPQCGGSMHSGPCKLPVPVEAIKVHRGAAKEAWERQQKEQDR